MKLPEKLKYNRIRKTMSFFLYKKIKEGGVSAKVLVVPGKFFDMHLKRYNKRLPSMAGAIYKKHPDFDRLFPNVDDLGGKDSLILIRDKVFELAEEKELESLIEHEFGHIFFGYCGAIKSRYDYQEQLADCFVGDWDSFKSLEKKWAVYNYKACKWCYSDMFVDEKTVVGHWFIYCKECGFWVGDGILNPLFVHGFIQHNIGRSKDDSYKTMKQILSHDENMYLTDLITRNQHFTKG